MSVRRLWIWMFLLCGSAAGGQVVESSSILDSSPSLLADLSSNDYFGISTAWLGDLNDDGHGEIAVGASQFPFGNGKVYILFTDADGEITSWQKIAKGVGGLSTAIADGANFGRSVAGLGDLDGDEIPDLAVGAPSDVIAPNVTGAVWVLFLNSDGTVKSEVKLGGGSGGVSGSLGGHSMCATPDLDGNGKSDLLVGAPLDGSTSGACYFLALNTDGTVSSQTKIAEGLNGFPLELPGQTLFGTSVASLGDVDGDTVNDFAVGALNLSIDVTDKDPGYAAILKMNSDETVKGVQLVGEGEGGFDGATLTEGGFGYSVSAIGDLNEDGVMELGIGQTSYPGETESNIGAVWLALMNESNLVIDEYLVSEDVGGFDIPLSSASFMGGSLTALPSAGPGQGITILVGAHGVESARGDLFKLVLDDAPWTSCDSWEFW